MKILFMNSALAWGGNEQWVNLAATALGREIPVSLAYRDETVGGRIAVPSIRLPFRHEADVETIFKLISFVRANGIDTLIPTKRKDYVIAGIVARVCGCLNVLRLGIVRDLKHSPVQSFIFNVLADGVIVNAVPIRDKLLESGFRKPDAVRVIHNGLQEEEIGRLARKKPVNPPFGFTVAAMGELSPRKGFDMLIRGFARFLSLRDIRDCGLLIIGEGDMKNDLEHLARSLGIGRHVIFTGFQKNPYPFLAASRVFVMTSRNEGISNAMLEAALLDNAIVSTRTAGGVRSVISDGDNGFLVDYGDEEKLAAVLHRLHAKPALLDRLSLEARQTVTGMFSMQRMTREIMSFCSSLHRQQSRSS